MILMPLGPTRVMPVLPNGARMLSAWPQLASRRSRGAETHGSARSWVPHKNVVAPECYMGSEGGQHDDQQNIYLRYLPNADWNWRRDFEAERSFHTIRNS